MTSLNKWNDLGLQMVDRNDHHLAQKHILLPNKPSYFKFKMKAVIQNTFYHNHVVFYSCKPDQQINKIVQSKHLLFGRVQIWINKSINRFYSPTRQCFREISCTSLKPDCISWWTFAKPWLLHDVYNIWSSLPCIENYDNRSKAKYGVRHPGVAEI